MSDGFLTAANATKLAALPLCDTTIPTPQLGAGADLAAAGVTQLAAGCTISRVTVYPLTAWSLAAIDTSAWELANATTGKSLATLTFSGAPPVVGTPVNFTLNANITE